MLARLIDFSLKNRLLVCLLAADLLVLGGRSLSVLPIDAFPDTTPVQVQINTTAAALNPEETEAQITGPVELALGGRRGGAIARRGEDHGVQRPLATVVIGGIVTNTLLTLLVLPALYTLRPRRTTAAA